MTLQTSIDHGAMNLNVRIITAASSYYQPIIYCKIAGIINFMDFVRLNYVFAKNWYLWPQKLSDACCEWWCSTRDWIRIFGKFGQIPNFFDIFYSDLLIDQHGVGILGIISEQKSQTFADSL